MGRSRNKNKHKCRFIEEEADESGDGHSDDDLSNDEEELEKQRLFVDDSYVKETREPCSPTHDSEKELDSDDLALIEENNEDAVIVRKRRKTAVVESEDDDYDSMEEFIEHDSSDDQVVVDRTVRQPRAPETPRVYATARPANVRRPVQIMPSYSNFRTPCTEEKQAKPARTWDFMRKKQAAKSKPPPQQPGYVRSADGLKYRKVDGTLVPATGVDHVHSSR